MRYEIVFAPEAVADFKKFLAHDRATLRDALEIHLRHEPTKISKSRIKRLHGISRPQFRLRVGDFRVFYDVRENVVEILAVIPKMDAVSWLEEYGERK